MTESDFNITVRELAEFVHRSGDLGGGAGFTGRDRAVRGIKGHQRLQSAGGEGYQSEVPLERLVERHGLRLLLRGRVDGLLDGQAPLVEEIKTVEGRLPLAPESVHWAQVKIYGALLSVDRGWSEVTLQLTYLDLRTDETTFFREKLTQETLTVFLEETLEIWFDWLLAQREWLIIRNRSIATLPFPFDRYRAGQKELATSVYRTIRDRRRMFVEAPTGLGKTLATLYPAVKALPLSGNGKIFYVTAKTLGRLAAEQAVERLRLSALRLRSVHLTAKHKICFTDHPSGCDLKVCPYALGYYDRIKPAVRELIKIERIDRSSIESVAQKHRVCPFELSLDAALWADVIIGDYNYLFDPSVKLQRFFDGEPTEHIALIDEAHNLVDRSREMYSATLQIDKLIVSPGAMGGSGSGRAKKSLSAARREITNYLAHMGPSLLPPRPHYQGAGVLMDPPDTVITVLKTVLRDLESFFSSQPVGVDLSAWLECYFAAYRFLQTAEFFDRSYRTIGDPGQQRLTLFCADPSKRLAETSRTLRSAIFFSATLSPLDYFMDVLGGTQDDVHQCYASPFRPEQLRVKIVRSDLSFHGRTGSLVAVGEAIKKHLICSPGNHLIFSPSFAYLTLLQAHLVGLGITAFAQASAMDESSREEFLRKFTGQRNSVGLAVLGGIFSEGIDLPGEQLIGVTVIGVGLPGLSLERDILRDYYGRNQRDGFEYAYQFPGMQRVIQAAGRLIRSEQDSGALLLIDQRFLEKRYEGLMPSWWQPEIG